MSLVSQQPASFGLDFSDGYIRIAQIEKKMGKIFLKSICQKKIDDNFIINGEIKDIKKMADEIKNTVGNLNKKIKTKFVSVALPECKTFIKFFTLKKDAPKISKDKIKEKIDCELKNNIPIEIADLRYDFQIIKETKENISVIVAAAPEEICDSYNKTIETAGLKTFSLETEAQAITRAIFNEKENFSETNIIINLGNEKTELIIFENGAIQSTASLEIKISKLIKEISSKLNITEVKAKKALQICGIDQKKGKGEIYKIVRDFFDEIILEIQKNFAHYSRFNNIKNKNLILNIAGEYSLLPYIKEYMKEKINCRCEIANPLISINTKNQKIPIEEASGFVVAIGLALRSSMIDEI
jgi:type IV pilus assembly protein PilM